MLKRLDFDDKGLIGVRLSGKVSKDDYTEFLNTMVQRFKDQGHQRLYVEILGLKGFAAAAIWEDFKFDLKNSRKIKACAIVGDRSWIKYMTYLSKPLFFWTKLKFFTESQRAEALRWIGASEQQVQTTLDSAS